LGLGDHRRGLDRNRPRGAGVSFYLFHRLKR
jgi:hypothetical protein